MTDHPTRQQIERFARGLLLPAETAAILHHLLDECEECVARHRALLLLATGCDREPAAPAGSESAYDGCLAGAAAFARRQEALLRLEKERVEQALAAAAGEPAAVLRLPAAELDRLRGWALAEAFMKQSWEARVEDPDRMLAWAMLAKLVAHNLDRRRWGDDAVEGLQIRALADLANAYRVCEKLDAADRVICAALERLRRGPSDPSVRGYTLHRWAALLADRRRFEESLLLLREVQALYLEVGDVDLAAQALIGQGLYTGYSGSPEGAIALLRQGLAMLDAERNPALATTARFNIALNLVECGHFREARRLLFEQGTRAAAARGKLGAIRVGWIDGKIASGLGDAEQAEALLVSARLSYAECGLHYLASLVGLDLALLYLERNRTADLYRLLAELIPAFRALGINREERMAVLVLEEVYEHECITASALKTVRALLARSERDLSRDRNSRQVSRGSSDGPERKGEPGGP